MKKINALILGGVFFSALAITGCTKDEGFQQESVNPAQEDQSHQRKFTLSKSNSTGWWVWECKDGSGGGSSPTKSGAKAAGKAACGSANVQITPPFAVMEFTHAQIAGPFEVDGPDDNGSFGDDLDLSETGPYVGVAVRNLDNDLVYHSANSISLNEMFYWLGDEDYDAIDDARKAVITLTMMGIYNGGETRSEIEDSHNLSPADFDQLINRDINENSEVEIDDQTGELTWNL